jgi:formate hydrogenlyase transcriptional activator
MGGVRASRAAAEHGLPRDQSAASLRRDARGYDEIIARSSLVCEALHAAQLLGERPLVFVAGEVGTPRVLVARLLHRAAELEGRFVRVRCSDEPGFARELFGDAVRGWPGGVHQASGGTLYLEAVERLSLGLQARLLRLVHGQSVRSQSAAREPLANIRVVATSEHELWPLVEDGLLREDLYCRLTAHRIALAPLRERPDEIAPLAQRLLYLAVRRRGGRARQLSPAMLAALAGYGWPGNVRELKRVIDALVASSDAPLLDLPRGWLAPRAEPEQSDELAEHDRELITEALRQSSGVLSGPNGAAALLGMEPKTLRFRMRRLGLARPAPDRR